MPSESEHVKKIQKSMEFAVPFATALVKLKEAVEKKQPVAFTIDEAKAMLEAMKLLKDAGKSERRITSP